MAEEEARTIGAVTDLEHLVVYPLGQGEMLGVLIVDIHCHSIGIGDDRNVIGRFGSAFDLVAVNACCGQLVDVVDHAEILCVKDIAALLVLEDRIELIGALFFHQVVAPAAWLGAFSAVGVTVYKVLRQQAPSRKADAHCAVYKDLDLKILWRLCAYLGDLLERELTGEHDSLGAHIVKRTSGGVVHYPRLGGNMYLHIGDVLFYKGQGSDVGSDKRIDACVPSFLAEAAEHRYLIVMRKGVAGKVNALAP